MYHVDNPFQSPAILSFCPGILGLERGIERVIGKINVVAYVEIEAFIIANLVAGMESGMVAPAPIWTDARTFDASPFCGKIHGIIGGYPCTPFSLAGSRSGEDHSGHIFPSISRAIEATRPIWCFFENVDDHLTLGYDIVYKDLQRMGYAVEAGVYSAEEAGAPHERQRLFILAIAHCFDWGLSEAKEWNHWIQASGGGEELANGNFYGYRAGAGGTIKTSSEIEGKTHRQKWNNTFRQWLRNVIGICNKELANPQYPERRPNFTSQHGSDEYNVQFSGSENTTGFEQCSKELENPAGDRSRQCEGTATEGRQSQPGYAGELPGGLEGPGGQLANATIIGVQGDGAKGQQITDIQTGEEISGCNSGGNRWPARPGEQQYEWEEPRSIEPGLGCTIDGYNFRDDLLRAIGNSVVEQTAAIAFIDLLNKHINGKT